MGIIRELRSATCEGESLAVCQSGPSEELREYVIESTAAGWSRTRILNKVVKIYGGDILLAPPKRGFALLLWLAPYAIVGAAGLAVVVSAKSWAKKSAAVNGHGTKEPKGASPYLARINKELKDFDS